MDVHFMGLPGCDGRGKLGANGIRGFRVPVLAHKIGRQLAFLGVDGEAGDLSVGWCIE
jgi:hypothetical protein